MSRSDNALTVKEYAKRIAELYGSTSTVIDAAKLCLKAKRSLSKSARLDLISSLPFSAPTFSRLVKIGGDTRIDDLKSLGLLPTGFSKIYLITRLDKKQLEAAIARKAITPRATRADLNRLRKGFGKDKASPVVCPLYAEIYLTRELPEEEMKALRSKLANLQNEFGLKLMLPEERFPERWERWMARKNAYIEAEARKLIANYFRQQKEKHQDISLKKTDEMKISKGEDEYNIERALGAIGLAEEYPLIVQRAEEKFASSVPVQFEYWPAVDEGDSWLEEFRQMQRNKKPSKWSDWFD